ncbi:hypothetical protein, partial [uncultured Gammaproteobacteria bacterium]
CVLFTPKYRKALVKKYLTFINGICLHKMAKIFLISLNFIHFYNSKKY